MCTTNGTTTVKRVLQVAADIRFQTYSLMELLMTGEEGDAQKVHKLCVYFIKLFS